MKIKTVVMLGLFFIPLLFLCTGIVTNAWLIFLLYFISGIGMAGIGMGVMHDAIHGSYSRNKKVNKILGYTMNFIGANASVWHIKHNILHHTYTNIHEADDDINMPFFLRFSPDDKHYKIQKLQFIYAWFFYSISTLSWVGFKDFERLFRYRKLGFITDKADFRKKLIYAFLWKLVYFSYSLILPIIMLPVSPWIVVLGFVTMHLFTGLAISCVFQCAHIMPSLNFPKADDGKLEQNWFVHQLSTTCNFSPKSKLFSWLIGGLNFQVEHHLFPHICHIHYPKISAIVEATAKEFGIPYHVKPNFYAALKDHGKMLYQLGRTSTPVGA